MLCDISNLGEVNHPKIVQIPKKSMVQRVVVGLNPNGDIVAISNVSRAAEAAGVTPDAVLGRKMWDWQHDEEAERIQAELGKVVVLGKPREYRVSSVVDGTTEVWDVSMRPTLGPCSVLVVANEVLPQRPPQVTERDALLLQMLADDKEPKTIAKALRMSVSGVHTHIKHLRLTFGVATTHGLVAAAWKQGLIT